MSKLSIHKLRNKMSEELLKNNDVNMGTINENGMNEVPCTDQVNNEQSKGDISAADGQESQETLDEVPVDQNNQEKIKSKTLVTLLSFLVRKMPYKVHYLFSYRKAIKHGLKIAFLIGNREVYSSQIDKLYNELGSNSDKKFSNPVIVVSLERALRSGLRAVDADGKEITLDTPNLWLYVALLDGQHRLMVCLEHLDVDLDLELIDYDGNLMSFIQILNSMDKNWNNEDRKNLIWRRVSLPTNYI